MFYFSGFDTANASRISRFVKSFGCEIPTSIHHSILSVLNKNIIKVRCQNGFKFSKPISSKTISSSNDFISLKKKFQFIRCRNSKIVNNVLPKCVPVNVASNKLHKIEIPNARRSPSSRDRSGNRQWMTQQQGHEQNVIAKHRHKMSRNAKGMYK